MQASHKYKSRWERLMSGWRMITKPGCAGPLLLLMPNGYPLKPRECQRGMHYGLRRPVGLKRVQKMSKVDLCFSSIKLTK